MTGKTQPFPFLNNSHSKIILITIGVLKLSTVGQLLKT